jgi:hypothetical protein
VTQQRQKAADRARAYRAGQKVVRIAQADAQVAALSV